MVAIEKDAALSGKLAPAKRPGLLRALKLVRSGKADGLVVWC
jgi:DNA invertase Pin-like site-specific DNA recombinase